MIIAVDGPAASGKGTIARALARHYGLPHLDTGLLYRAVALDRAARRSSIPTIEADAVAACDFDDALLDDPALRTDEIGKARLDRLGASAGARRPAPAPARASRTSPAARCSTGATSAR